MSIVNCILYLNIVKHRSHVCLALNRVHVLLLLGQGDIADVLLELLEAGGGDHLVASLARGLQRHRDHDLAQGLGCHARLGGGLALG